MMMCGMCVMGIQVSDAESTVQKVDEELAKLQATLDNIKQARPFEDLTVRCVVIILLLDIP